VNLHRPEKLEPEFRCCSHLCDVREQRCHCVPSYIQYSSGWKMYFIKLFPLSYCKQFLSKFLWISVHSSEDRCTTVSVSVFTLNVTWRQQTMLTILFLVYRQYLMVCNIK
jgi:hypothetical protein